MFLRRSQILLRIFKLIRQLEPVLLTFENFPGRGEKFFSGTENGNKFLKKKLKTCEVVTDHCCRRIQNCSNDVTLLVRWCYPRYLKSALPGLRMNIIHLRFFTNVHFRSQLITRDTKKLGSIDPSSSHSITQIGLEVSFDCSELRALLNLWASYVP